MLKSPRKVRNTNNTLRKRKNRRKRVSTDADRAVWLLIERSWLNLRPLFDGPAKLTHPRASIEIPWRGAYTDFID